MSGINMFERRADWYRKKTTGTIKAPTKAKARKPRRRKKPEIEERLRERATRDSNGCLRWFGTLTQDGYGIIQINKRKWAAHRLSWILHNGPIEDGLIVRHKCDNPPCVAIEHLELGTRADNRRDAIKRGRAVVFVHQSELAKGVAEIERLNAEIVELKRKLKNSKNVMRAWRMRARRAEDVNAKPTPSRLTRGLRS